MLFGFEDRVAPPALLPLSWGEAPCLADLVEEYALPEERLAVKMGLVAGELDALAASCEAARRLAEKIREEAPGASPHRLAESRGITVVEERWGIVAGRFFQWGECTGRADRIVLNRWAIEQVTAGIARWGQPRELAALVAKRLPDLILAHELHHCLLAEAEAPPVPPLARELAAHSFARTLDSPLLYDRLVILARGKIVDRLAETAAKREFGREPSR